MAIINLTDAQWNFREAPGRWTIAEVVEHLGLWEIAWAREIGEGLHSPDLVDAQRAAASGPDQYYRDFIMEDKPHEAPDFAKPTGLIEGKNTLAFFQLKRDQAIAFAETSQANMRIHYERTDSKFPRNMHQAHIYQWGHVDRHLRQIREIKAHANYPKQGFLLGGIKKFHRTSTRRTMPVRKPNLTGMVRFSRCRLP